jgi:ElaB/YqjD/DUF883 family membrane-anchored ribosome-binding protein
MDTERDTSESAAMQSDVERLQKQIKELKADLQELGVLARSAAREKLNQAEETVHDYLDEGRERFDEYGDMVTDYVRAKPFQSVLMAFVIGFIMSVFVRRR